MIGRAKNIIGRKDSADFPQLELHGITVKTDSGAYTSSFHCHQIQLFRKHETQWVKCRFLDPLHPQYHEKEFVFSVFKVRDRKSVV